jgi:hypothetical protein
VMFAPHASKTPRCRVWRCRVRERTESLPDATPER